MSDSEEEPEQEPEEEDNRGFHQYRAETVRAALAGAPGRIPDAALIHAARKTRQQVWEVRDLRRPTPPTTSKLSHNHPNANIKTK